MTVNTQIKRRTREKLVLDAAAPNMPAGPGCAAGTGRGVCIRRHLAASGGCRPASALPRPAPPVFRPRALLRRCCTARPFPPRCPLLAGRPFARPFRPRAPRSLSRILCSIDRPVRPPLPQPCRRGIGSSWPLRPGHACMVARGGATSAKLCSASSRTFGPSIAILPGMPVGGTRAPERMRSSRPGCSRPSRS